MTHTEFNLSKEVLEDGTEQRTYTRVVDSTSDERTTNNTVRHQYKTLNDIEKQQMLDLKDAGLAFLNLCDNIGSSRELSLAKTKMQEAVFWSVNHVTK